MNTDSEIVFNPGIDAVDVDVDVADVNDVNDARGVDIVDANSNEEDEEKEKKRPELLIRLKWNLSSPKPSIRQSPLMMRTSRPIS